MLPSVRFVVLKKSNGCIWRFFWRARTGNIVIESSNGTLWEMLDRKLIDKYTCVALEYGTYAPDNGLRAMQADHWLHNQGEVDWLEPKTQTIKGALKKHFYPASQDWKEIVLWRSRQVQRQSLACLMLS